MTYYYTKDWPEYIPHSGPVYDWISNLALSYLGCFIFYIFQIYYPKRKAYLNLKPNILKYVNGLTSQMKDLSNYLKHNKGYFDETDIFFFDGGKQLYIDLIKERVETIEDYCDKILSYQQYLDDEMIILITDINNCIYIDNFNYVYINRKSFIMKNSKVSDLKVGIAGLNELLTKLDKINI